ncbi:MAG: hypothetical protein Q9184_001212 [Pyrenodesmia sp. 2 TL-2023]
MSGRTFEALGRMQPVRLQYLEITSYTPIVGKRIRYIRHDNAVTLEALDSYGRPINGSFDPGLNFDGVNLVQVALLTACNVLELKGLDLGVVIKPDFLFPDWWCCLGSLAFESCFGLEGTLTLLADGKNQHGQPLLSELRLHSLRIRHDGANTDQRFKAKVRDFIISLPGLVNLSVLLESNDKPPLDFADVLAKHGKSLRTLVLEERGLYKRFFELSKGDESTSTGHDESPSTRQLSQVLQYCRDLVELGITLDWTELPCRELDSLLSEVCQLRTLSIRNTHPSFISSSYLFKIDETLLEGKQEVCVNNVLQMLFGQGDRKARWKAALQTLGIESLTYDQPRHTFGRLQIYRIDTWSGHNGDQRYLVTLREAGTYQETEAAGGDVTVFKSTWLK